jgi:hypothetical protein
MTMEPYDRILVVADWRADTHAIIAGVLRWGEERAAAFRVVVPAWLHGLDWIGDPTASLPCARAKADELARSFARAGIPLVSATAGDPDPVAAAEDALDTWPANRILFFTTSRLHLATRLHHATRLPTELVAIGAPRERFTWVRRGGRHCVVDRSPTATARL